MDLGLDGRTALVTGASSGIGRAAAAQLANEGALVVGAARRVELVDELARQSAGGDRIHSIQHDAMLPGAALDLVSRVQNRHGPVDILINAAGRSLPMSLESSEQDWAGTYVLNFRHTIELTQAVLPAMRSRGWGRVVTFTGTTEPVQVNGSSPMKSATQVWMKAVSRVVAAEGVTVNCISPGRIHSEQVSIFFPPEVEAVIARDQIPASRFGEPEEAAALATFLTGEPARYITGTTIAVDGGLSMFAF